MKSAKLYLFILILLASSNFNLPPKDIKKSKAPDSILKTVIADNLEKSGKVSLDLYVMSFCPYGVNAEKTLIPILQEMGDQVEFNIFYIVNEKPGNIFQSLHGEPEVLENRRQLVIARHFPARFLEYILLRASDYNKNDWSVTAAAVGLDIDNIDELVNQEEEIEAFRANISNSNTKKIFGSPSLFINGKRFRGPYTLGTDNFVKQCEGGTNNGQACEFFTDCPNACVGGANDGDACINNIDCKGGCEGGVNVGAACINDLECGNKCVGGSNDGQQCTNDINCRDACVGGANDGEECINNLGCPGGACSNTGACSDRGKCNLTAACSNHGACKELVTWYLDNDGDGYGGGQTQEATSAPGPGWINSSAGSDCNDNDATIHPGANEPCGPPDKNCNGETLACPPVRMNLNSECKSGHIELRWETDADISANIFVIERSTDGEKWEPAGSLTVPGIVLAYKKYAFTDMQSDETSNFYRVVAYDARGAKRFSELIGSPCPSIQNIALSPNPVNDLAIVSIPSLQEAPIELTLHDSRGKVVQVMKTNLHLGKNQFQFHLGKLSPGLYILTGRGGNFFKKFKILKK